MKAMCVILSFSVMLIGCYSQSPLTQDEAVPSNETVVFYLKDGSYVVSNAEGHVRISSGYQVVGELVKDKHAQGRFEGVIQDTDIRNVTANKFNVVRTSIGAVLGVCGAFVVVGAIVWVAEGGRMP